jgi:hypothetical protein
VNEQAAMARRLAVALRDAGFGAHVQGAGVNWDLRVSAPQRALRVHCFWYDRMISGLMLGTNPANARSRLRAAREPYEGPEYLVKLEDSGDQVADGRAHDQAAVLACARMWLAGATLDALVPVVPFVDERGRAARALAARIDPTLPREIAGDPTYELWVHGDGRSCKVIGGACSFLFGPVQIGFAAGLDDIPAAVETWLVARPSIAELPTAVPGVQLERHAEVLAADPVRWHWLHVLDRIADPDDVLAPMSDLIAVLASSPIASTFYSYSSLNRFCFSASSHYPWVNDGLPVIAPAASGEFLVDGQRLDLPRTVQVVEATLAVYPVRPFFGSSHDLPSKT